MPKRRRRLPRPEPLQRDKLLPLLRESHLATLRSLKVNGEYHPDWAFTYDYIMQEIPDDFQHSQIVKAMKLLRREGLARFTQTFSEDDYLVCGSGHQITDKGRSVLADLEAHIVANDPVNQGKWLYEQAMISEGKTPGFDAPLWIELTQEEQAQWLDKANSST